MEYLAWGSLSLGGLSFAKKKKFVQTEYLPAE